MEILVLKIFNLRDYFERFLCWLDHWLSCMLDCIHVCVFHISKNCFEKLSRHLLDTLLSVELLKHFFKHNLDTSSIPGGLIEKAPVSSIAFRHLLDWSSFCSWIYSLFLDSFLDTSAIEDQILDTYLNSFLDTFRYLSCRALLKGLYIPLSRFFSHFFDLSQSVHNYSSPKHSHFHSKPLPQGFFKLFQVSLYLASS